MKLLPEHASILVGIKLLHTAIWFFFAACILALPVAGLRRQFGRAARCTEDRTDNFDIYLPVWLARYNQTIFGTLFLAGGLLVLWQWLFPAMKKERLRLTEIGPAGRVPVVCGS